MKDIQNGLSTGSSPESTTGQSGSVPPLVVFAHAASPLGFFTPLPKGAIFRMPVPPTGGFAPAASPLGFFTPLPKGATFPMFVPSTIRLVPPPSSTLISDQQADCQRKKAMKNRYRYKMHLTGTPWARLFRKYYDRIIIMPGTMDQMYLPLYLDYQEFWLGTGTLPHHRWNGNFRRPSSYPTGRMDGVILAKTKWRLQR